MSGRILLLSDAGREDVCEFWRASIDAYWPNCPLPVTIMGESTAEGWSRLLLRHLEEIEEDWVLLWIDDNVLVRPVLVAEFERCLNYFLSHGDIGLFHVGRSTHREGLIPIPDLVPYAYYPQALGDMTHAMAPHPYLWRRKALWQVTESSAELTTLAQDDGWAGFYNWELGGGYVLLEHGWQAVTMIGDWGQDIPRVAIRICNAVRQGMGWAGCALTVSGRIGFKLNPGRPRASRAEGCPTPGSDKWRAAGRVNRRQQ